MFKMMISTHSKDFRIFIAVLSNMCTKEREQVPSIFAAVAFFQKSNDVVQHFVIP
jgi:hypothetical protein